MYTTASFDCPDVGQNCQSSTSESIVIVRIYLYLLAYVEVNLDFSVNGQNYMCASWKDFDGTTFNHRIRN